MSRRRGNDENENKGSFSELLLFVAVIACIYCIMAFFDSSLAGEGGRSLGQYLRGVWGGAVILPILFLLYTCAAKLLKFRIPKFRRQFFGTLMLYISFSFLLGLLRESGWTSESFLFTPGRFGGGLAKFFILNTGTFITLLITIGLFLLSAVFFGSKIPLLLMKIRIRLPKLPKLKFRPKIKSKPRERQRREPESERESEQEYEDSIPEPVFKSPKREQYDDDYDINIDIPPAKFDFQLPTLRPAPDEPQYVEEEIDLLPENVMSNAVEVIDNALALMDSDEMKAPEQKRTAPSPRVKRLRRPLPPVTTFPADEDEKPKEDSKPSASENVFNLPEETAKYLHEKSSFPPPVEIFGPRTKSEPDREILRHSEKQAKTITSTLKTFGVNSSVAHIVTGPAFIQYQLELAPGTKVIRISGLAEDLAMSLAVMAVRIEAPILGTRYVGIEVPRSDRKTIALRNIIESDEYISSSARLPLPLGVKVDGKISVAGLEDMPHLLIAGNTGSGRAMFVNSCIMSMCYRRKPEDLRVILIDPRHVEFAVYDGLPHLIAPPVYDPDSAVKALTWAYDEMEKRTAAFASARVRNLASFNRKQKNESRLPEIVIVINELADLVYSSGPELEGIIMRLAQKSGASGIYMILAAQRPSPDVFTTMIKSNIPARAAFTLSAEADSKNIIGSNDAMSLTGKGDMLFRNTGSPHTIRFQTPYVNEDKISDFTEYMFASLEPPDMMKF